MFVPLETIDAQTCPATWAEATAAHKAFCIREWHGGRGLFDAALTSTTCRGFLRYTRYLFDAGPRTCLYDPTTLALRGYYAFDGKAMFKAITCGSTPDQYDSKDCGVLTCEGVAPDSVACPLPASLTGVDPASGQCRAARMLLNCPVTQNVNRLCLSNDRFRCSDDTTASDAGVPSGCDDLCAPGDYAVACGKPGPGTSPAPPAGCKDGRPTPGGVVFYCCPCGS
jgi:hypothetical protein